METPPNTWEPFELFLKDGSPYRLTPEPGYQLRVTHACLESNPLRDDEDPTYASKTPVSLYWQGEDGVQHFIVVLRPTLEHACTRLRLDFNGPVALVAKGGGLGVFAAFQLVKPHELYGTYAAEDEDALPTLGDKTFTWHSDPLFFENNAPLRRRRGKRRASERDDEDEAPALVVKSPAVRPSHVPSSVSLAEECQGEPVAREPEDAPRVTPPRMMALVPSSSPERSASRSEDETSEYLVRIPSVPSSSSPPTTARRLEPVVLKLPVVPPTPKPRTPKPEEKPDVHGSEVVRSPKLRFKGVPLGVLKGRSRLGAHTSPRLRPLPPSAEKKGVQWNPKSPDVRFITPPLSAMHRAFPGGILDLGMPLVDQQALDDATPSGSTVPGAPLAGLAGNTEMSPETTELKPRRGFTYGQHMPKKPPVITPKHLRPTLI